MLFGANSWNVIDPAPGVALEDIETLPDRARVLLARNKSAPRLQYGFIQMSGAVEMMEGMEYHFQAFTAVCRRLGRARIHRADDQTALRHEAVAYLNRVGQFYAFATSDFVKTAAIDAATSLPAMTRIMVFRNKHVAHRSIDQPRREDTDTLKLSHAWCLSAIGPLLFAPKPERPFRSAKNVRTLADVASLIRSSFRRGYAGFQIHDGTDHVNFHPESEHPQIMTEAYALIDQLLATP